MNKKDTTDSNKEDANEISKEDINNVQYRVKKIMSMIHLRFNLVSPILFNMDINFYDDLIKRGIPVNTMFTDGKKIGISLSFAKKQTDKTLLFGMLHEIFHNIFMHPLRLNDTNIFKDPLLTLAEEYIVNHETIKYLNLCFNVKDTDLLPIKYNCDFDPTHSTCKNGDKDQFVIPYCPNCISDKDDVVSVYKRLKQEGKVKYKKRPFFLVDDFTGMDRKQAMKVKEILSGILYTTSVTKGDFPGNLIEKIEKLVYGKIDWRKEIEDYLTRKGIISGIQTMSPYKYNYKHALFKHHRILLNAPIAKKPKEIVIAVDTSGSISRDEYTAFISELQRILYFKDKIYFIECDAEIKDAQFVSMNNFKEVAFNIKGRGGTDFRPVFEHIEKHNISTDLLIFFTDGEGNFPKKEPRYSVLWVVTSAYDNDSTVDVPFGRKIVLRLD